MRGRIPEGSLEFDSFSRAKKKETFAYLVRKPESVNKVVPRSPKGDFSGDHRFTRWYWPSRTPSTIHSDPSKPVGVADSAGICQKAV
jgi:hypothetical protein